MHLYYRTSRTGAYRGGCDSRRVKGEPPEGTHDGSPADNAPASQPHRSSIYQTNPRKVAQATESQPCTSTSPSCARSAISASSSGPRDSADGVVQSSSASSTWKAIGCSSKIRGCASPRGIAMASSVAALHRSVGPVLEYRLHIVSTCEKDDAGSPPQRVALGALAHSRQAPVVAAADLRQRKLAGRHVAQPGRLRRVAVPNGPPENLGTGVHSPDGSRLPAGKRPRIHARSRCDRVASGMTAGIRCGSSPYAFHGKIGLRAGACRGQALPGLDRARPLPRCRISWRRWSDTPEAEPADQANDWSWATSEYRPAIRERMRVTSPRISSTASRRSSRSTIMAAGA